MKPLNTLALILALVYVALLVAAPSFAILGRFDLTAWSLVLSVVVGSIAVILNEYTREVRE